MSAVKYMLDDVPFDAGVIIPDEEDVPEEPNQCNYCGTVFDTDGKPMEGNGCPECMDYPPYWEDAQ